MAPNQPGFSNVELPENFSEKELRWSYWWLDNKDKLRKLGIAAFITVDAILVLVGLWGFTDWLVISGAKEEIAMRQLTTRTVLGTSGSEVQEMQIDVPSIFSTPGNKYDLLVRVENPNQAYWMKLDYQFTYGANSTPARSSFILPGQIKYLSELGVASESGVDGVQLKIISRSFQRVDRHAIRDYGDWLESRLTIDTLNPKVTPPEPGARVPVVATKFTVFNRTAFSYYDADLLVLAKRGDAVIGANRVRIDRLSRGEKRDIELYWYQTLPGVNKIEVLYDINPFDAKSYQAPGT